MDETKFLLFVYMIKSGSELEYIFISVWITNSRLFSLLFLYRQREKSSNAVAEADNIGRTTVTPRPLGPYSEESYDLSTEDFLKR